MARPWTHPEPLPVGPGQESVWSYPRPPRLEPSARLIEVELAGTCIARSERAQRVLETSHPPTYYIHPDDVAWDLIVPAPGTSLCEWKGAASYWTVDVGTARAERAGWSYPTPTPGFAAVADHVAFYPALVTCRVDGQQVTPQPGGFYGGWITPHVVGPFKGGPATLGW